MTHLSHDPEMAYISWIERALPLLRELAERERIALGGSMQDTLDAIAAGEDLVG